MSTKPVIGIVANETRDPGLLYATKVANWLRDNEYAYTFDEESAYSSDFLIVLGGDGTMLRASHTAAKYATPMLGINLGNMGYLTDVDRHDGIAAIEKMLKGEFKREQRMMIECRGQLALNEIIIHRDSASKVMSFRIFVNGNHMDTIRADGVIAATPTGSTAYNLSAGGPILSPDADMIVINAICPHTLYARPWVISGRDEITMSHVGAAGEGESTPAIVSMDGCAKFSLKQDEIITIRRSECTACVVKTAGVDFFGVLRKKMRK